MWLNAISSHQYNGNDDVFAKMLCWSPYSIAEANELEGDDLDQLFFGWLSCS